MPQGTLNLNMTEPTLQTESRRYRFGVFEADAATGELRRKGIRVKLNAQPFQVLIMFLERPGELLTREEISRELWPDGTFVDYEHGVNSAVNRLREALGDSAGNARFIETLARRGYRFIAPVERIEASGSPPPLTEPPHPDPSPAPLETRRRILSSPEELPNVPHPVTRTLFLLLQVMYLGFYIGALANLPEIRELLSALATPTAIFILLIVTAAILIPTRAFILSAVAFRAPRAREKFLTLWPFLLPLDWLWALSPFLLLHHINFGLA
ncbi:MAG TPA: winged helix-turn-helix domain-containing protein, partial [Acidobacteriaceae bacterium]|nr:winged helix-turn-helix domain-containing protein [Acidobacteriaceae bacterium]